MESPRTLLTIVRHGQTSANIEGVWHGSIDSPLTERGLQQASRVARHIGETYPDTTALYSSNLQRARLTARGRLLGNQVFARFLP